MRPSPLHRSDLQDQSCAARSPPSRTDQLTMLVLGIWRRQTTIRVRCSCRTGRVGRLKRPAPAPAPVNAHPHSPAPAAAAPPQSPPRRAQGPNNNTPISPPGLIMLASTACSAQCAIGSRQALRRRPAAVAVNARGTRSSGRLICRYTGGYEAPRCAMVAGLASPGPAAGRHRGRHSSRHAGDSNPASQARAPQPTNQPTRRCTPPRPAAARPATASTG